MYVKIFVCIHTSSQCIANQTGSTVELRHTTTTQSFAIPISGTRGGLSRASNSLHR